MPQMAPLLWLNMMTFFLISLLGFFSVIYYMSLPGKPDMTQSESYISQNLWKW